ncbi:hypothetical protein V6N11_003794 [Hibiscus sabdariffa]|uniref:DIS3-like exonuclease 2 n=1 Tax=Hibiscus sabdariffa TaxID=183260 RepID=A0ABR2SEJ5_9ROSI
MKGGSGVAEPPVIVERVEDADKEKKKKRRSNRRSKHNSACNSVSEARGETSDGFKSEDKTKSLTSMNCSSSKQGLEMASNEQTPVTASDVGFTSMPTMHINERVSFVCDDTAVDVGGTFSNSCPEPNAYAGSSPFHQFEGFARKKLFAAHWPIEAVNEALEKGEAFKALFRVNAHNRLEAYCKIDGVPTDVLVSGISSQNRAVEGDIVVIKVDPLGLWSKMKGSNGSSNNSTPVEDCNIVQEVNGVADNSYKGKGTLDADCEYGNGRSGVPLEKSFYDGTQVTREVAYNHVNGHRQCGLECSHAGLLPGQNDGINSVDMLAAMVSRYPLKRPTAKVVAIVEKSLRRNAIVGFLNVKQWFSYRDLNRKDAKKNSAIFDHEYVTLTPTDPRFPKMTVFVRDLPDSIKKRLADGDVTIEMELLAAQIEDWSVESPSPRASVSRSFGRGSELETQINAILYENAIHCADFPPPVFSCLPSTPWEIPPEEFQTRKDLRDLCVFTIDPSTASDLDDALSIEKLTKDTFRVGVHIADVSYFVLPNKALDVEAQIRSTSVYLLQKKIQMLPSLLSEELGSLNPGIDRLAFSMFWELNRTGDVLDRWIGRTVISSCCKLSYKHAQDIIQGIIDLEKSDTLEGLPQLHGKFEWADVIRSVNCLHEISKTLKEKRFSDGALQLESTKVVYLFDEDGVPYDSSLSERMDSNFLVEEFMLLANMTAAEVISRAFPNGALLRRHPEPNMRKLKEFEAFCRKHCLALDTSSSSQLQQSLEKLREKLKDDSVLFDILISYASKPMQLASYFCSGDLKDNLNDWGHYGLAVPLYTHFTSPLRRYPDIVVHRTLAAVIEAEELYMKHRRVLKGNNGEEVSRKCFTGIYFDKEAAESPQGKDALSNAALKHGIPSPELLGDVAAYCNERKLASRHAEDACEKLYMWFLLKRREILLSDARVLGLGPRFMSVYIQKLAIERRIYYDEVEGLTVEWLESTSTLVLSLSCHKRLFKSGGPRNYMSLGNAAWVVNPYVLSMETDGTADCDATCMVRGEVEPTSKSWVDPGTFPLTVRMLSTVPVALYAIGGDDGPLEIGVRLYMSSYLKGFSSYGSLRPASRFRPPSTPVQYKLSKGGEIVRTDIQVGDDTRPLFSVSLWKKELRSTVVAGDIVLLQNVKITKFRDVFEARTDEWSSLLRLVHPYQSLVSKSAIELVAECRMGIVVKEKLSKVIEWVQRTGYSAIDNVDPYDRQKRQLSRNWKVPEPNKFRECPSLPEVLCLNSHCKAIFSASVGEIFLPITWRHIGVSENENMFISRRLYTSADNSLAEDLICTGCRLCGSPLHQEHGPIVGRVPLYCEKSSDRLHAVSLIYRPFMLYLWDEYEHMPVLVKNNAAEKLFGNIKAERVLLCYKELKCDKTLDPGCVAENSHRSCGTRTRDSPNAAGTSYAEYCSSDAHERQECRQDLKGINVFKIWLVVLKMLLQQGKNSPLKFEVAVNASLDIENGRFEMLSVSTPCFKNSPWNELNV